MQEMEALEGKNLPELREIGKALGIANVTVKKKRELIELIAAAGSAPGESAPEGAAAVAQPVKRGRRPRMAKAESPELPAAPHEERSDRETAAPEPAAETAAAPAPESEPKDRKSVV